MTSPRLTRRQALARLQARIRACRKCLTAGYPITPPPVVHGAITAQVMTIGQAPGPTEVVAQRPFNAGAGRRLFQWLAEAGFDEMEFRATQYMTAVTRCYPGRAKGGHGDRVAGREEQAFCRPWLEQEIDLVDPQLIIPIGRLAIGLFFDGKLPLEKIVGTQVERGGRVIIPLPHPSGASTWHNKPENQARLKKAIRLIEKQREALGL
jgi:uracil-DNA glycosylase